MNHIENPSSAENDETKANYNQDQSQDKTTEKNAPEENTIPETIDGAEKTPRKRSDLLYKSIRFGFGNNDAETRFEKLIKEFPDDKEKESAFADALTAAIADFSDKNFISQLLSKTAPGREKAVNEKIAAVKNKLHNQIDAVDLAAKLSFNDSYIPMGNDALAYKVTKIISYLRSEEVRCENKFNEKATTEVFSYYFPNGELGGCSLALNGEHLISYETDGVKEKKNLTKLSEIIKSQIGAGKIKPKEVVDRFKEIKSNTESKSEILKLLEKGSEDEIISYISERAK
jgi:hypothetical protein